MKQSLVVPVTLDIYMPGATTAQTVTVCRELVKLGRDPRATVTLDDPSVARMHAVLEVRERSVTLIDLGAGTRRNGASVTRAELAHGDALELGGVRVAVSFGAPRVADNATAAATAAPALPALPSTPALPSVPAAHGPTGSTANAAAPLDEPVFQVRKRGELDPREVEVAGAHAVEVTVRWNRSVLHVAHLAAKQGFALVTAEAPRKPAGAALASGFLAGAGLISVAAATGSFAAGALGAVVAAAGTGAGVALEQKNQALATDSARFVVDEALLGGLARLEVVRAGASGAQFVVPEGAAGRVEYDSQPARDFSALRADGTLVAAGAGVAALPVEPGARYVLEVGSLTVLARVVNAPRAVARGGKRDGAILRSGAGALLAVAGLVGASLFASAGDPMLASQGLDDERLEAIRAMVQHQMDRAPEPQRAEPTPEETPSQQAAGSSGQRAAGASGRVGDRRVTQPTNARLAVAHNHDGPMTLGRAASREQVSTRGILAALTGGPLAAGNAGPLSPFGALQENGADAESANGHFNGATIGMADGFNGLGPTGTGIGGGGDGQGTIGLDNWGTVGRSHGPGGDGDGDYGNTVGRNLRRRDSHGPRLTPLPMGPVAGMSAEAIRRVVLRNIGQVRYCHEQGLAQNPNLEGRVVVRFVIGGDGQVLGSGVAESSVSVPTVGTCIANAVRRWTFPRPEGNGTAIVNYPFALEGSVQ